MNFNITDLRVSFRFLLGAALIAVFSMPQAQAMHFHRKPTFGRAHRVSARSKRGAKLHGQQNIDTGRAQQIQTALVREHYLSSEPNGVWDQASKDAMVKYQADHGWQTKVTPDSRALISLGLGPEHVAGTAPSTIAAGASIPASPRTTAAASPQTAPAHTLGSAISAHNTLQNLVLGQ